MLSIKVFTKTLSMSLLLSVTAFAFSPTAQAITVRAGSGGASASAGGVSVAVGERTRPVSSENERLRRRVHRLERQIERMDRRLMHVEDYLERGPLPPPRREPLQNVCILTDSGYSKTFMGKGRNRIDAEFEARKNCEDAVHSSYCSGAEIRCDEQRYVDERHVCVLTDTGYSKTFRGEGSTALEAEAQAKQSCQNEVHASYCAPAKVRCAAD